MPVPLLKLADSPPTTVSPGTSVLAAVDAMREARVGAVAVVEGEQLKGIFTERDLMLRVVAADLEPAATTVGEVMVKDPVSVKPDTPRPEALKLMIDNHFRHLPIADADGKLLAMVSIRNLLKHQVERLEGHMASLEQYIAADGPGG